MKVRDLMTRPVVTLDEHASIGDAIGAMTGNQVRHLPIVRGKKPIAVISDRHLRSVEGALAAEIGSARSGDGRYEAAVRSIIDGPPVTVVAGASVRDAIDAMLDARVSSVLVVDAAGDLVGIVTTIDVLRAARDLL